MHETTMLEEDDVRKGDQPKKQVWTAMPKFRKSLAFRLFFLLLLVSSVVFFSLTMLIIRANTTHLMEEIIRNAKSTNNLIAGAIHHSMLLNRLEDATQIISTLGREPGVEGIRIYNKKGTIVFSTNNKDLGQAADLKAEQCIVCHAGERPLEHIPETMRPRIFASPAGYRVLGVIQSIRNEPSCAAPGCHASPSEKKILGVLDSKFSLAQVDKNILSNRNQMILYSMGAILIIELFAGIFIWRMVHQRVDKLAEGTRKVKSGNLDFSVQLKGSDEIADLAGSFNSMVMNLKRVEEESAELSRKMIHVAKMASMGELAANMAHEINNPLGGILTYTKLLRRQISTNSVTEKEREVASEHLEIIINEIKRCGNIVKNLLYFSQTPDCLFEQVNIHDIISKGLLITNLVFEINELRTVKKLEAKDPYLIGNANEIQQALVAMFINSAEAMSEGGILTVKTEDVQDEDVLRIHVEDNGKGIPKEIQSCIFEPFFSTKEEVYGVGLGLSVVYGIVLRHQGTIEVESEPGQGTVFIITLPRKRKQKEHKETIGQYLVSGP
jgi:two-component system NtrC family sensor kinase